MSGCASACSAVTSASSSRARPRNGPPDAVRTTPATRRAVAPLEALVERRVLAVDRAGAALHPARARRRASSPAATRLSLLASASVTPCSSAQSVARTPANPTIGVQDDVAARTARAVRPGRRRPGRARRACSAASSSSGVEPDWSAQSSSSGCVRDDVDRLPADRPGRAEDRDAFHAARMPDGP